MDLTIPERVAFWADYTPNASALIAFGRPPLSYRRLWQQVCEVVEALNMFGLGRDSRIAIVLPNGAEMLVAFLGASAGSVSAPLNTGYKAQEFKFYLTDLKANALIAQAGHSTPARSVAESLRIPVIDLVPETDREAGTFTLHGVNHPSPPRICLAEPEDVALILHTSGTTSRPKMVPLTHKNLCVSAYHIADTLELCETDRCLNVMPLFHIHGLVGAAVSSLVTGGSVVAASGIEPDQFFRSLQDHRPTWYTAVPTMHQALLSYATENPQAVDGVSFRLIRSCSAALPRQIMEGLEKLFRIPVIEAYGMTEAAHQIASNPLPPLQRKPGSVGQASGTEVAIMAEDGNLLRTGEVGEIVIRGENIIAGYLDNPQANAKNFSGGWFRTGDQGYLDRDGYLFITGRLKEIINRGGEKVAPREVDEALLGHPAIRQAVTFAVPHPTLGEEIAAVVALRDGASVTGDAIQRYAASRLASFKVPCQIVIVDEIPKGPTGKLRRIGLAEEFGSKLRPEFVAPRDDVEKGLAAIWSHALGVKEISIQDNFFALGGDSFRAAQVFAQIESAYGKRLPLTVLLEAATIKQLSTILREERTPAASNCLVAIQPKGDKPPFFCVHGPGGHVINYRNLAFHLGQGQPLYGLQAQGLDGKQDPHTRIEDMAKHYVREIRSLQPEGPYFLGGFCFGGQVAYEMACRLAAQGQKVAMLALFEAYVRRYPESFPTTPSHCKPHRFTRSMMLHARTILRLRGKDRTRYFLRRIRNAKVKIQMGMWDILKSLFATIQVSFPRAFEIKDLSLIHYQAGRAYTPQPYPGRVNVFLARESPEIPSEDPRLAWDKLATGGIEIHELPVSHDEMLSEPHVRALAAELKACLAREQQPSDG
ncbi:MAG: AMP-binding protein [Candidatus Binatia bacterium]